MKLSILSCILIASFFFGSCHTPKTTAQKNTNQMDQITDVYWMLSEINGKPVPQGLMKAPFIKLINKENRAIGTGGCNDFFGTFEKSKDNKISFSGIGATQMACDQMETDAEIYKVLENTTNYQINQKTLSFQDASMNALAKFVAVENEALNGTWILSVFPEAKTSLDSLLESDKPTITLNFPDKKVNGKGICNTFHTEVTTSENKIEFGTISSTRMHCPIEGEAAFFEALKSVNRFNLSSDQKTLTLFRGDLLFLRFKKQ